MILGEPSQRISKLTKDVFQKQTKKQKNKQILIPIASPIII